MRSLTQTIPTFLRELKRRKLYSAVVAYVALCLVLVELTDALVQALELPGVINQVLTIVLLMGFPVVVVLSWIFDIGPGGVQRTEARPTTPVGSGEDATKRAGGAAGPGAPPSAGAGRPVGLGRVGAAIALQRTAVPPPAPVRRESVPEAPETPAAPPDPERVQRISLAHVRHELKTPINAIIGYSEMLLEDAEDAGEEATAADLERIGKAGRQLLSLVDHILNPDREDAGDLESYGARIRADLRTPINAVTGYAELLAEGCAGSATEWMVADLERIRDAALRLLELSNDIVQLATGENDGGPPGAAVAEASVLTEGVLAKIRPLPPDADAVDRRGVLLVVDDNPVNRDLVSRQLARKGYQVATAENGREALERLEEQAVDLVLLDVLMPVMDGIETLRRIRGRPELRNTPVIMMSSLDEIDGAIRCIEIGADDYLAKPVHPAMLDVRIGAALEVKRLRAGEELLRCRIDEGDAAAGRLLRSLFPASVADRLERGETEIADASDQTTALVCDLERSVRGGPLVDPTRRLATLRWLLGVFEDEAERHGVETLVVQGSAVVLLAGFPTAVPDPADRVAALSLAVVEAVRAANPDGEPVPLRFGLHAGAAAGAVVDGERLVYHVWGDAVDLARRLEAEAAAGEIHTSPAVYGLLKDRFAFQRRGIVQIPGRGQMRAFYLTGRPVVAEV